MAQKYRRPKPFDNGAAVAVAHEQAAMTLDVQACESEREVQTRAAEGIPDPLPDQGVGVVVLGVVVEPVLHFVIDAVVAEVSDPDYGRDFVGDVVSFAHRFAHHVDRLCRRVGVERVEEDKPRVQVIARADLDRLFARRCCWRSERRDS